MTKDLSDDLDAIVVFSGGMDSTVCLLWAIKQWPGRVGALSFHYGQRHSSEINAARAICEELDVPHKVITLQFFPQLCRNALTSPTPDIETHETCVICGGDGLGIHDETCYNCDGAGQIPRDLPTTFVPGRNILFLTMAAVVAREHGIENLVGGVSEADYSGYPDCRSGFIDSLNETLNFGLDTTILIHTPLIHKTKTETWAMAADVSFAMYEFVRDRTVTCYRGTPGAGCGDCPACVLRERGRVAYWAQKGKCPRCEGTGWVRKGLHHGYPLEERCPECNL